ncbi:lytic transglycosylase domain-containing protein [Streptomyces sp. NPDC051776]|uniref:lytic transglycosylase domain-containing protein n=1 Tax=Streptomyces sp. NPDC051776 TaxID=3155414 RepID=UPI00343FD555
MAAQFGRRIRRGAATTAVAALAMAALTASQAPGLLDSERQSASGPSPATETPIDGGSPYYTDLPPLNTPDKPRASAGLPGKGKAEAGIPETVLDAYKKAAAALAGSNPGCNLRWELLAAIGKVESGQARGGRVDAEGTTLSPIVGPQLNGEGFADIRDTDGGAYDGDTRHDRAVGPMQFIPSTWANWGADGNRDGEKDPGNIYDAALAAGRYLCAGSRDLSDRADLERAILGYNRSQEYLRTVLSWFEFYKKGTHHVPDGTGVLPAGTGPDGEDDGAQGSGAGPGGAKDSADSQGSRNGPKNSPVKDEDEPQPPKEEDGEAGTPDPEKPAPAATVTAFAHVGSRELTATAGGEFADPPRVRTRDASGKAVADVPVRYEIRGATEARFPGKTVRVTVRTGSDGTASAPKLLAGGKAGDFTVRATVVGRTLPAVDFTAAVTVAPAPEADALARTSEEPLKAETGGEFAEPVEVKATCQGAVAAGVPVTATMITSDPDDPVVNDKGPYFKDEDDKPVRTLEALKTDANGLLKLPKIFTDERTGTFLLRLTTEGGTTLTLELEVTEPAGGGQ